jgi:hypothetical protein
MALRLSSTGLRRRLRLRLRLGRPTSLTDGLPYVGYMELSARAARERGFAAFKRAPAYRAVLEHVTCEQGQGYLDWTLMQSPELISLFDRFRENDRFGSPVVCDYDGYGLFSPTTLRYVKVYSDLRCFFRDLDGLRIVEIGGGYGGQCLVIHAGARPGSYTLVDLPAPLELQRRYLEANGVERVTFSAPDELDPIAEYDLVVSNYAFSECRRQVQDHYLTRVLRRTSRGYATCNWITPPEFRSYGRDELLMAVPGSRFVDEEPLTGAANAILVWGADVAGVERYQRLGARSRHA